MSEQELRNDGETEPKLKRSIAAMILFETITDIARISKNKLPKTNEDSELVLDSLRFIESSLCVRCCEVVNISYKLFHAACLDVFANYASAKNGTRLKTFVNEAVYSAKMQANNLQ